MKGDFQDECNRTACSNKNAVYYNHSTRKYYCRECAGIINTFNPEAFQMYGHVLCTLENSEQNVQECDASKDQSLVEPLAQNNVISEEVYMPCEQNEAEGYMFLQNGATILLKKVKLPLAQTPPPVKGVPDSAEEVLKSKFFKAFDEGYTDFEQEQLWQWIETNILVKGVETDAKEQTKK